MRLCLIAAVLALSACQLAWPGKSPEVPAANPITAGQISVTPLDGPPAPPDPAPVSAAPAAEPAPNPAADAAADPVPPPPPPKSAAQIACEKIGRAHV